MKKEQKTKKRIFEKSLINFVFFSVLIVFLFVMTGFVFRVVNVEKNNPVFVNEDFKYITYDGSYFYSIDQAPKNLECIEMNWLGGARLGGSSRVNQAFRDRYTYALYKDSEGHRYIWVKDADFYKEGFVWADWIKDYRYFDRFENSYFYKER